jgi:signal transduction histidine kinase
MRSSLRARFALLAAGLVLVVAAMVALGGYLTMRHGLLERAEREARNQAAQIAAMVETSPAQSAQANANLVDIRDPALTQQRLGHGYIVVVSGPAGAPIQTSPSSVYRAGLRLPVGFVGNCLRVGDGYARLSTPALALACQRVGSHTRPLGAVSVGVPLADSLGLLATLRSALVVGVLAGALIAGALALLLARRATRPIGRIARTAQAIRSGERPLQRIDYSGRDELGALAGVLDETFAELENALERQRRFGADASHELRTPLAAIRANVELLRGWAAADPVARESALAALDQASRRAARLGEDLLYLATVEREPPRIRAPVRLDELLVAVVREAAGLRPEVTIRIVELDEATVNGDGLALQQLLLNLMDNALRVSPPHATVTTALRAQHGKATLNITDRGPGIEPQELERIFERFYTRRESGAPSGGAGLGLTIARAIAKDHDGQLTARNEPVGGATFALTLPLVLPDTHGAATKPIMNPAAVTPREPGASGRSSMTVYR